MSILDDNAGIISKDLPELLTLAASCGEPYVGGLYLDPVTVQLRLLFLKNDGLYVLEQQGTITGSTQYTEWRVSNKEQIPTQVWDEFVTGYILALKIRQYYTNLRQLNLTSVINTVA